MTIVPFKPELEPEPAADTTSISAAIEVEQIVIGYAMQDTEIARQIVALIRPEDCVDPYHGQMIAILVDGFTAGRESPGRELIVGTLGNDGPSADMDLRSYLRRCVSAAAGDGAGRNAWRDAVAAMRELSAGRALAAIGHHLASQPGDVATLIGETQQALDDLTARMRHGRVTAYTAHDAAKDALAAIDDETTTTPTGFLDLQWLFGGWPRGELSVVAARPGMGKSAFAVSAGVNAARAGHHAMMFSLEMSKVQLGARLITDSAYSGDDPVPYESIINHRVDARHGRRLPPAVARLDGVALKIEEQRGLSLADIVARTRRYAADLERAGKRLDLVIVDHMGLVRPSNRYAGNRTREVAEISDGLATLAKDLRIAVLALSQLNRGVEGRDNKRPSLADLRDSGAIEEDASLVLFLYRPAYYLEQRLDHPELEADRVTELEAKKHVLEVICAKNRNGRSGTTKLYIDAAANALRNESFGR